MLGRALGFLRWAVDGLSWLASRHPAQIWLLPLPTAVLLMLTTWVVELAAQWAATICLHLPQAHALLCLACAVLTVPQQRCLRLNLPTLAVSFAVLILHLQYATSVALTHFPRPVALLVVGLPNLILTLYLVVSWVMCMVLTMSPTAARQVIWKAYTVWGPALLIPQAVLVLMGCVLSYGSTDHSTGCP